jgi:predicted TIM-barrel fold metal-dependent hydrolase
MSNLTTENPFKKTSAIDVHNHFYPPAYLKKLQKGGYVTQVTEDSEGNSIIAYEGDYNIYSPDHRDIEFRLAELDRVGIKAQMLRLTTPGVHIEEKDRGTYLAKITNDDVSDIAKRFPGRFYGLAALPLQDPEASALELKRSVKELGLKGGTLFTNINGKTLDAPSFQCVFETARELDVPLFIHPTTPNPADAFLAFRLAALVGFNVDTTLTFAKFIFGGLFDRIPGLKLIASHLGGCLPYLAERLDRGYYAYTACQSIHKAPSEYIKENVYIDCVSFDPLAVDFALKFMGADRLMVGSDYPHQIGDIEKCSWVINELCASEDEKNKIFHTNAERLFNL